MKMFDILKNKVLVATKSGHGSSPPSPTQQHVESDHRRQGSDYVTGFSLPVDINLAPSTCISSQHKQQTGNRHNQTRSLERGYPLLNDVTLRQDNSGDSSPRPYSNATPRHAIVECSPKLLKVNPSTQSHILEGFMGLLWFTYVSVRNWSPVQVESTSSNSLVLFYPHIEHFIHNLWFLSVMSVLVMPHKGLE